MRKFLVLFLVIVSSIVFITAGCTKDDVEEFIDPCDETALSSTIDVPFVFAANIHYQDDVPYAGSVHFKVNKTYCDGSVSGEYYLTQIPSGANGYWYSGMSYVYTYGNLDDLVWVTFTFETPSYEPHKEIGTFSYGYVQQYYNGWDPIEHTFEIHLPWDSPEAK